MRLIITFIAFFLIQLKGYSQNNNKYAELISQAFELYKSKVYLKSARKYMDAFSIKRSQPTMNDRYNAACSWALANKKDSSFNQLFHISNHDSYSNIKHLLSDSDLNLLHDDERWNELVKIVKINNEKAEMLLDKKLIVILDSIQVEDQKYRSQMKEVEQVYGQKSPQMSILLNQMAIKDSLNLIQVKKIIDERGWLGPEIIGQQGNMTLFLVVQHADLQTQKKYLPIMKKAVRNKKADASNFAFLRDRVAKRTNKKQIYGSQVGREKESGIYYVFPLISPKNVNKRRAKMGLPPIEDYLSYWNIKWDPIEHKKQKINHK